MGTTCGFRWREAGERERLWVVNPTHPIADGLGECIEIPESEMYGEPFTIPEPDELVFISWFEGGDVLRSGCCWTRGAGAIFYLSPGHELYPIYHQPEIQRVIRNAIHWARRAGRRRTCRAMCRWKTREKRLRRRDRNCTMPAADCDDCAIPGVDARGGPPFPALLAHRRSTPSTRTVIRARPLIWA
jgi:trehalose utilization protein